MSGIFLSVGDGLRHFARNAPCIIEKNCFPVLYGEIIRHIQEVDHGKPFAHQYPSPPSYHPPPRTHQWEKGSSTGKLPAGRRLFRGGLSVGLLLPCAGGGPLGAGTFGGSLLLYVVHTGGAAPVRRSPSRNVGGVGMGRRLPPLCHSATGDPLLCGSPLPARRAPLPRANLPPFVLAILQIQSGTYQ